MKVLEKIEKGYHEKKAVRKIIYPDSDGKPMADNTLQFNWIVKITENLEIMYEHEPNVFVAGDLLWYPVEGNNKIRVAPDALVAFGRPKGYRGSYMTWEEGNIVPQVVFEILSPGNTPQEMTNKLQFYDYHGVEEYYFYDPYRIVLKGWIRLANELTEIEDMNGWVSPRLKITFKIRDGDLHIFRPDGTEFLSTLEINREKEVHKQRAELERQKAEAQRQRAETAERIAERLAAKLRLLGINPDEVQD